MIYSTFFILDYRKPKKGGRKWNPIRRNWMWKMTTDYFPLNVIKTHDLPLDKNYLFGYHPHGILSYGATTTFLGAYSGFEEKFPGLKNNLCTLEMNFSVPFLRDYLMANGLVDASKAAISYILTKKGKGNSATLVVGGA